MTTTADYETSLASLDKYAGIIPAPYAQPPAKYVPLEALDAHALALMQFKLREVILAPWLHSQDLCMVFAARGIGKTHFAIAVAYAVATGGTFAKWSAPQPRKVLYLDGELPGGVMQQRLLMHCPDVEPEPGYLRIFTPDLLPEGQLMPDLSTLEGQLSIDDMILDAEVVIERLGTHRTRERGRELATYRGLDIEPQTARHCGNSCAPRWQGWAATRHQQARGLA